MRDLLSKVVTGSMIAGAAEGRTMKAKAAAAAPIRNLRMSIPAFASLPYA